jgi:hypothetical protein
MSMERRIPFPPTPDVIQISYRAFHRWWLRYLGWTNFIILGGSAGMCLLPLLAPDDPVAPWIAIPGGINFLFTAAQNIHGYYFNRRRYFGREEAFLDRVELGFSAEGITAYTNEEAILVPWNRFAYLWQFPDCWILVCTAESVSSHPSSRGFAPLPTELLDEELKSLIATNIRASGGIISENPGLGLGLKYRENVT